MPRPRPTFVRSADIEKRQPLEAKTHALHAAAIAMFREFLTNQGVPTPLQLLLAAPVLLDRLVRSFGVHLYHSDVPLYVFVHAVTGIQHAELSIRKQLPLTWELVAVWSELEPGGHRVPTPVPVFRALFVIACCWGWFRWAAVTAIAFLGIGRAGEPVTALRRSLLLPADVLGTISGKAFLQITAPKSRRRGLGRVQHLSLSDAPVVAFLERHLGPLAPHECLYPFSKAAYRSRWNRILVTLGIPREAGMVPGGLRGGGCVAEYYRGTSIAELQWRMRLKSTETLSCYLQEVAVLTSLIELPGHVQERLNLVNKFFNSCLKW